MNATSVISASIQWPSPSDHRVGYSTLLTRLHVGSLALRPALLLFGNSRHWITPALLPHATGAYGQLPGRDFNPLDLLLLLPTNDPSYTMVILDRLSKLPQVYIAQGLELFENN